MKKIYVSLFMFLFFFGCDFGTTSQPKDSIDEALEYFRSLRDNDSWRNLFVRDQIDKLEVLGFEGTKISNDKLHHLLIFPKLNHLILSETKITEEGLESLKTSNINHLQIDLTPNSNVVIKTLMKWKQLDDLNIAYTKVDDRAIDDILKIKTLRDITVPGTNITEKGKERLRKHGIYIEEERYGLNNEQKLLLRSYGYICFKDDFDCWPPEKITPAILKRDKVMEDSDFKD
ncbi:serine/threonine protein kinase [Leptospira gomenensis]|uniref:serine/threonine protein kinase n=1 Tax=Leptospira gomenensis TaxID=2484974 RepID=UPI001AEFC3EE|nr:serine/threonine protein kinase [Leptospira gomenensis]